MSICIIDLSDNQFTPTKIEKIYDQHLECNKKNKEQYGEVNTPFSFVFNMLSIIPIVEFKNKDNKWLDAGAGHGNYMICLYCILYVSLRINMPNDEERKHHIIKNMLYMVEMNPENVTTLREIFGEDANIYENDYLEIDNNTFIRPNIIIGNPPYNVNGLAKVPTNTSKSKKADGRTIWRDFVHKNLSLLEENGLMCILIPSIWLKPDKYGMYDLLLQYKITNLHCLDASESSKLFHQSAQTPICYFLLEKVNTTPNYHNNTNTTYNNINNTNTNIITIYDSSKQGYIDFPLYKNIPIPLKFASIVKKILSKRLLYSELKIIKTNMPCNNALTFTNNQTSLTQYPCIHSCLLSKQKKPELSIKYSPIPLNYHGIPKLVMGHKMYGFPYLDEDGMYGISNRDNYIIINKSFAELKILQLCLSTTLILFLYETTRYRMRYLEKYVFEYLPDFSLISQFHIIPPTLNKLNEFMYEFFELSTDEKQFIERFHKTKYSFFVE